MRPLLVRVEWDEEAQVWVATSDDVPGLTTEEKYFEALIEKLKVMIPELLSLNGEHAFQGDISFEMFSRRVETVRVAVV